ncbi:hypothetical protein Dimus_006771 [Dionaea muscipula]
MLEDLGLNQQQESIGDEMVLPEVAEEGILPSEGSIREVGKRDSPYLGALKSGGRKMSTEAAGEQEVVTGDAMGSVIQGVNVNVSRPEKIAEDSSVVNGRIGGSDQEA